MQYIFFVTFVLTLFIAQTTFCSEKQSEEFFFTSQKSNTVYRIVCGPYLNYANLSESICDLYIKTLNINLSFSSKCHPVKLYLARILIFL